jgi:murein L,D-transpeptidase YafK
MKRIYILLILLVLVILAWIFRPYHEIATLPILRNLTKERTVTQRVEQYGSAARVRLKPYFDKAGVTYPTQRVILLALKSERVMQIYAPDPKHTYRFIRSYPILAASGDLGPKLHDGDDQVPEGIYPIESLNPNSAYHLSLRVGYPNDFDREQAKKDGRSKLGGDIMIHGSNVSIGCLAMGDETAEDLFVLADDTGLSNVTVVIAPVDFRKGKTVPKQARLPEWSAVLYSQIKAQLALLPAPEEAK